MSAPRRDSNAEARIQAAIVEWIRTVSSDLVVFHVPNGGKRGKAELEPVEIDPAKRGGWRVEEEFVNAIRGMERVTHTDLFTGVKYMEWTTAVSRSLHKGRAVMLPL